MPLPQRNAQNALSNRNQRAAAVRLTDVIILAALILHNYDCLFHCELTERLVRAPLPPHSSRSRPAFKAIQCCPHIEVNEGIFQT